MDLYTSEQLAEMLEKSQRTIQRWAHNGKLPTPLNLNNRTVWLAADLRIWLSANCPDADLDALEVAV